MNKLTYTPMCRTNASDTVIVADGDAMLADRLALLYGLLIRARARLGDCICYGDEGSVDYAARMQLIRDIDLTLATYSEDSADEDDE